MKIEKVVQKPWRFGHERRVWTGFFADDVDGFSGVGNTPAQAIADLRDQHNTFKREGQQSA